MADTRITGFDGAVGAGGTLISGTHDAIIRQFTVSFPRVLTNVTGFGDTLQHNRLGITSINGNASGGPRYDAANTAPGVADRAAGGTSLLLTIATGCSYTFIAAFHNMTHSSDKIADSPLNFDFENGDSETLTIAWDETP